MRSLLVVVIGLAAGCGFTAPSGQSSPIDAAATADAPRPSDGGDAALDAMIDGASGPQCPAGYSALLAASTAASRYRFVATPVAWDVAEADCADDAMPGDRATHLIVLGDNLELTALIGGLSGNAMLTDQWIGSTDLQDEGTFRYVTTEQNTLTLNPTMNNDNKDCVRIKMDGTEEARTCTEANKYACECDGVAADPQRFPSFPNGNNNGPEN